MKLIVFSALLVFSNQVLAQEATDILSSVKGIEASISKCHANYVFSLPGIELQEKFERDNRRRYGIQPTGSDAFQERLKAGDVLRECRTSVKERIRAETPKLKDAFKQRKRYELGMDFLVQAMTTIDVTGNDAGFGTESTKLNSMVNRIELELAP